MPEFVVTKDSKSEGSNTVRVPIFDSKLIQKELYQKLIKSLRKS